MLVVRFHFAGKFDDDGYSLNYNGGPVAELRYHTYIGISWHCLSREVICVIILPLQWKIMLISFGFYLDATSPMN